MGKQRRTGKALRSAAGHRRSRPRRAPTPLALLRKAIWYLALSLSTAGETFQRWAASGCAHGSALALLALGAALFLLSALLCFGGILRL